MPQVPYSPVPTVTPPDPSTSRISVPAIGAAFGTEMGEAFGNLGKGIEKAGNELYARAEALQQLRNEADARDADTDFMIQASDIHARYKSLQGAEAAARLPEFKEELIALRDRIGQGLVSPYAQKLYDAQSKGTVSKTIFSAAEYAAGQNKKSLSGSSIARMDAIVDGFYKDPQNDKAVLEAEGALRQETRFQADILGLTPEQEKEAGDKYVSKAITNRILSTANSKPFEAEQMFKQYRSKIHGDDIKRVEERLEGRLNTIGATVSSDKLLADMPAPGEGWKASKSLDHYLDKADKWTKQNFPDNDRMAHSVKEQVRVGYYRRLRDYQDQVNRDLETVGNVVTGYGTGKYPKTLDEALDASPEIREAYYRLPVSKQKAINTRIRDNTLGKQYKTQEGQDRFFELLGMSKGSGDDKQKFLDTDLNAEPLPLVGDFSVNKLKARRLAMQKEPDDPRVNVAMKTLVDTYPKDFPRASDDVKKFNVFRGAVTEMMIKHEEIHGKPMDRKQIQEMGSYLLRDMNADKWGGYYPFGKERKFAVPDSEIEERINDYKKANKPPPSKEQARIEILHKMYRELYEKEMTPVKKDTGRVGQ